MATQPDDKTGDIVLDEAASADPYWVAENNQRAEQLETDRRERALHAALHPGLRGEFPAPLDDVLTDAAKILAFLSGAAK